jgi:hypothetical protein
MCIPTLAIGLLGSAVSAAGAMASANSQANAAEYNAQVERINARSNRQKGGRQQEDIDNKYDKVEGQGIAAASKGGVDSGFGSAALTIFGEGFENRERDKGAAYVNAEGAATANENKAKDYDAQAKSHRQAGMFSAAGSFLSGLGGAVKQSSALSING